MRAASWRTALFAAGLLASGLSPRSFADERAATPGLGDPGALVEITLSAGRPDSNAVVLAGQDARQQLIVTGRYASGQFRDLTRQAQFEVNPAGAVLIDAAGVVQPVQEGAATITARHASGPAASLQLAVSLHDKPINFATQIVPIFTKQGCNSGGCHGKSGGQNGFRLSLLGFEPQEDYEHLVKEGRGRRISPASPARSLLLQKASGQLPHGGGVRIEADSPAYAMLRRWIEQGLPYGSPNDPTVTRIEVSPSERAMPLNGDQQLAAVAYYSDGSTEDVTAMTKFEPNDTEMAEVSERGLVKVRDLTGTVAVMARYQGHVAVFRASVPLGVTVENLPPAKNFIDELVFKQLRTLGVPPSAVCDDATFLRRAAIDIAGRLPTPEEAERFAADTDPLKREKWIDQLLASGEYADYFATKWSAVLRNKRRQDNYARGTYLFRAWIRDSLNANRPYDQFVREIVGASGEIGSNPAVAWYREVREPSQQVEDTAQLFLGLRVQCARCHHHPFEKWSQKDYYGLTAFFARVGRKPGLQSGEERIYHQRGVALANHPKTGAAIKPTGLDAEPLDLSADQDPRQALVDWMAAPENPFFARALVNRYWKHFFGRGLVDPEDDMRVTNPASNPELLDALARRFIETRFDLKKLIREICTSQTYQLSSEPNAHNARDRQNYSRYYPKRLSAEALMDGLDTVTGTASRFNGLPEGTHATQLPDASFNNYFLTVFGRPEGSSACECERTGDANLAQSLHLLNSSTVQDKLRNDGGRAARLAQDQSRPHEQRLHELYLRVYSRPPRPEETQIALAHIQRTNNDRQAYEDLLWALVNTKEFLFNH